MRSRFSLTGRGRVGSVRKHFIIFILSVATSFGATGDWPQWLGPQRDGHAIQNGKPIDRLSVDLKPLWRKSIGSGFSSPVVSGESLVYFDENGEKEVAHLVEANTGKEIWKSEIAPRYADEWSAGPRSTPLIDGDYAYVLSCNGELRCLSLKDGHVVWGMSFEKDFGVKFLGSKAKEGTASRRGNNGSCLIDVGEIIVPVGATDGATLVCLDKLNGKLKWKSGDEEAAYSSPQVATIAGIKQVVYLSADSLAGFDRVDGKVLWRVPLRTAAKRHAATPVIFGDTVIVNSHTVGLQGFRITKKDGKLEVAKAWANPDLKINLSTPVIVNDFLFGQGPNKDFICADARSGQTKWSNPGFGKENSSTIAISNHLLVLTDTGELVLVAADSTKYAELGRLQVCGKNWNYPAYANGKFYVRDARELICYELGL